MTSQISEVPSWRLSVLPLQSGGRLRATGRLARRFRSHGRSVGQARVRLWKWELQRLATETGLTISVSHLLPGTSKWNKIEHRLFSFISQNWRGKPLLTHATIVKLIDATATSTGLRVRCVLDRREYPKKVVISDDQMATINLVAHKFHGDCSHTIRPGIR